MNISGNKEKSPDKLRSGENHERQTELDFPSIDELKQYFKDSNRESFVEPIDKLCSEVEELLSEDSKEARDSLLDEQIDKISGTEKEMYSGHLQAIKAGIDRMLDTR